MINLVAVFLYQHIKLKIKLKNKMKSYLLVYIIIIIFGVVVLEAETRDVLTGVDGFVLVQVGASAGKLYMFQNFYYFIEQLFKYHFRKLQFDLCFLKFEVLPNVLSFVQLRVDNIDIRYIKFI